VNRAYLLAGSLGLLGAIAQLPAQAASPAELSPAAEPAASLVASTPTLVAEVPAAPPAPIENGPTATAAPSLEPIAAPSISIGQQQTFTDTTVAQGAPVTSVSQLSDVDPSSWAFQALQSLIERYGCIAGYPDGTFRGNRALTRYEFAAGTYACLNSLAERIGQLGPEDLATIRRLQEEFAAELATLRGRVDALEVRTTELEANQFSTTTKLQGEALFAGQYGEQGLAGDTEPTVLARVRLNFNTSFGGDDLLTTQLEVGNGGEDIIGQDLENGLGVPLFNGSAAAFLGFTPSPDLAAAPFPVDLGAVDYGPGNGTAGTTPILRRLAYTFRPVENLAITFGPRLFPSDFVDFNSYANLSSLDFSSGFFVNNPLIITNPVDFLGGAGAAFDFNPGGGPVTFRGTYVAASPTNTIPNTFGGGLLGDPYQATAELEFSPSDAFALRLQYTTATTFDMKRDAYGANAELTIADRVGLFGRYGYGEFDSFGETAAAGVPDFEAQTFMAGIAFRDLFVPGSLLGIAVGQPFFGDDVELAAEEPQRNYEAFYRFAVNDNITVTPAVLVITNPNNGATGTGTIYQGLLRTTFTF